MPDALFAHPRLVMVTDTLDGERRDLDAYLGILTDLGARRVLDLGCGTGTLALLLVRSGLEVIAVDPAQASVAAARGKPGADGVRWIVGLAGDLRKQEIGGAVDAVTMTGNAAQAVIDPREWADTLTSVHRLLRPGGHLVFESRRPGARAWTGWNERDTRRTLDVPGVGPVDCWVELTGRDGPLVSFRWTFVFRSDGAVLSSDSTLRFRDRGELEADLVGAGYRVVDVRQAPDRPGREYVVIARRPDPEAVGPAGKP